MSEEQHLKERVRDAEYALMNIQDFINYLFDTELDYMTQSEAWSKFTTWEDSQEDITKKNKK